MKKYFFAGLLMVLSHGYAGDAPAMADLQKNMTPDQALQQLMKGNARFASNHPIQIDYLEHTAQIAQAQHPVAAVLSCIDSRVPPDVVFNQSVGNVFVTRIAANVLNQDVLGGLEYTTAVVGSKVIVVMGHENCGAVKGACQGVQLGNLTGLLDKIKPAVSDATKTFGKKACDNAQFINMAAEDNVRRVVALIPKESPVIAKLVAKGQVKIVGAMYHLSTGQVTVLQ